MDGRTALALLALAACRPDAAEAPVRAMPGADGCGAGGYASLIGTGIAALTLPADLNARVVGPDTAVTMELDPTRLNIRTDGAGVVTGLDCG